MRAARCEVHGDPKNIVIRELPDPVAGPGQVVVAIEAAAVNYPDVLIAADRYQVSFPTPFTTGSEFAGKVLQIGSGVEGLTVGDPVMGSAMGGAFADRIAVASTSLTPIPAGLDMIHASAFNVTYRTAYHSLRTFGSMKSGDWVVVLGSAGGVGTACVDVATRLGGRVIAVASTKDRADLCRPLGAVETIAYDQEDLKVRIKEITGGGADVVIDPVGGPYAEKSIRALTWGGRYVCVGFAQGEIPKIALNLVLLKGAIIRGFEIRTLAAHAPEAVKEGAAELTRLVGEGMKPYVSETFSLDDVPSALKKVAERKASGKIVIDMTR